MGIFRLAARGPSAEGRSILTILLILSNFFSKIRIHSFSFSIKLATFQDSGSAASYLTARWITAIPLVSFL